MIFWNGERLTLRAPGVDSMRLRFPIGKLPGYVATALVITVTSLWTLWGVAEMFYEGWWGSWGNRLPYLVPAGCCLALTLLAMTWPRAGGWLIVGIGAAFTLWWWNMSARRGLLTPRIVAGTFPVSGLLVVTGVLFVLEGRRRQVVRAAGWRPPVRWVHRNAHYVVAIGVPLLVAVGISVYWLPTVLARVDDGDRGPRLIEGHGVTLIWAPEGPGWSGPKHGAVTGAGDLERPRHLSWNDIALYGADPVGFEDKPGHLDADASLSDMEATGLCRYLSEEGLSLMAEP